MTDKYLFPRDPQKDARLSTQTHVYTRASDDCRGTWEFCAVVPRTNVKGRNFGKEHPEYRAVLEYNRFSGEYRTRPLTEVLENNE